MLQNMRSVMDMVNSSLLYFRPYTILFFFPYFRFIVDLR